MYTEKQMARRARRLRLAIRRSGGIDVLVTHAPARHLNDFESMSHRGFECFNDLMDEFEPKLFAHGHVHRSYGMNIPRKTERGSTLVVNACGYCVIDL